MSAAAKRLAISLTVAERDELQQLAHEAGEPIATVAGRLVRAALAHHGAWRASLDAAGTDADPREVLAFAYELDSFATRLQDRARRSR